MSLVRVTDSRVLESVLGQGSSKESRDQGLKGIARARARARASTLRSSLCFRFFEAISFEIDKKLTFGPKSGYLKNKLSISKKQLLCQTL